MYKHNLTIVLSINRPKLQLKRQSKALALDTQKYSHIRGKYLKEE
jgi:hypothetical protein